MQKRWQEFSRRQTYVRAKKWLNLALFLCITLILCFGSFWGIHRLIRDDLQSRLDIQASKIRQAFIGRLQSYSDALFHLSAFVNQSGLITKDEYQKLIAGMKIFNQYPGISAVAVSVLFDHEQQALFEDIVNDYNKGSRLFPKRNLGARDLQSAVLLIEPSTASRKNTIGFDSLSDPKRREALEMSIQLNAAVMTAPLHLVSNSLIPSGNKKKDLGFVLSVPFSVKGSQVSKKLANLETINGNVQAGFRYNDLLEEVFGAPSVSTEKWNFTLREVSNENSEVFYDRFETQRPPEDDLVSIDQFSIYGRTYELVVTPLPNFFSHSDRLLPLVASAGVLLVGFLLLLLFKSTLNQLEDERLARERSRQTQIKLRRQAVLLAKLNEFGMSISKESDPDLILLKFFEFGEKEEFESVTILREIDDSEILEIIRAGEQLYSELKVSDMNGLLGALSRIGKKDIEQTPIFLEQLGAKDLRDWHVLRVRLNNKSSFLFLGLRSEEIEKEDIELMHSTFSQLVIAFENTALLRRAEESSRLKTAFLANMSHEIRTPLNAIVGFSQMLSKAPANSDRRERLTQYIQKNTELLTHLVDDILDIAKVEAGKIEYSVQATRLDQVLAETKAVFELRARDKGIQLRMDLKTDLPRTIQTDEFRLKQILYNLIGNAVKFTDRGAVSIRVYSEREGPGVLLTFEIEDTGIGIALEHQSKLFDAFFQGDASTTRKFGGSGLGLALSRRLASELDGSISLLSSMPDKGSIFSLSIHCETSKTVSYFNTLDDLLSHSGVNSDIQPQEAIPSLSGKTILLVEDSEDNQIIFTHFLEQAGAKVLVAGDGREAIQQVHQIPELDLVLMDIQIPIMDGKAATKTLRSEGFTLPIIALTAHALESERRSCIQAGCNGQITKPVSSETLIREIARYLKDYSDLKDTNDSEIDSKLDTGK